MKFPRILSKLHPEPPAGCCIIYTLSMENPAPDLEIAIGTEASAKYSNILAGEFVFE